MRNANGRQGGGQLPTFRARAYDTEYVERWEKQDRRNRRLSHMHHPFMLVIDLINDLIDKWRH